MAMGRGKSAAFVLGLGVLLWACESSTSAILYRNQTLKQWCDPNPLLKAVWKIINQPNDMFVTRENALRITHRWDSTFNDECQFTVEAERSRGLVLNVNQLYLRPDLRDPQNSCMDYFRLKFRNGTKTGRMCGLVNATLASSNTMAVRSFVVPDGKVEIKIRIDDIHRLRGREYLYMDFLFTQYDDCQTTNPISNFQCTDQMCIHNKYVNDGNINCPYPLCVDEASCQNKTVVIPQVGNSKRAIIGGIAAAVVLAVLVPISICCCCEFCRKGAVSRGVRSRNVPMPGSGAGAGAGAGAGGERSAAPGGGGGRRHRHRSNRSASRGNRRAEHLPREETAMRPQNVGFSAVVGGSPPPSLEDHKESPPPTYESLFPGR